MNFQSDGPRARLGLFDNTVNIAYVAAKLLRAQGVDAELVQPQKVPFNQLPFWEDVDMAVPSSADLSGGHEEYWSRLEEESGWHAPPWIRPLDASLARDLVDAGRLLPTIARSMPAPLVPAGMAVAMSLAGAARSLREYDFVIAQGPSAAAAFLSGTPYAVMTTGWDIRALPFLTTARNPVHRARAWLQRATLRRSRRLLSTLPAHDLEYIRRLSLEDHTTVLPAPVNVDEYEQVLAGSSADVFGPELAARIHGRFVVFCPSRVEFGIKGTDRLLRGFESFARRHPRSLLVVLDWGGDVDAARALAGELGVAENVAFLPFVMSKIRLVRAFKLVDVVADQFVLTAYGAIARDALACGRPVISSYDPSASQPHPVDDPAPIVSASQPEQIASALEQLIDPLERARRGADSLAWIRRNHQTAPVARLLEFLQDLGASG